MRKKWFTLAELLVVLVIIWILSTILIRTYLTVANISFRAQQQKNLTQDILYFSQTLQNFADRNTLDYERYEKDTLYNNQWFTDTLYLTWSDWSLAIYTSGNCMDSTTKVVDLISIASWWCSVYVNKNGEILQLTSPFKVYVTKLMFKIIPYYSMSQYMWSGSSSCATHTLACISSPGFWLFGTAYAPQYSLDWHKNISLPLQEFFTL